MKVGTLLFGFPRLVFGYSPVLFFGLLVFQPFDLWQAAVENGLVEAVRGFPKRLQQEQRCWRPANWMWTMDGLLFAAEVERILNWYPDIKADLFVGCKVNQATTFTIDGEDVKAFYDPRRVARKNSSPWCCI